jgi:delta-aminolevulinic acid dehydratase/porphobilinogen synthase
MSMNVEISMPSVEIPLDLLIDEMSEIVKLVIKAVIVCGIPLEKDKDCIRASTCISKFCSSILTRA